MEFSGLSRQTIHNYSMLGLIKAAKRTGAGHRLYGEETFETLEKIKALKRDHTLSEIREMLRSQTTRTQQDKDVRDEGKRDQGERPVD